MRIHYNTININMTDKKEQDNKPNEIPAINTSEFLRISDPETEEVYVEQRL